MNVVVILKPSQLLFEIAFIPERNLLQKFPPDRAGKLFGEEKLRLQKEISETRAFAPLGVSTLAIVARMRAKTRNRLFMAGEVR